MCVYAYLIPIFDFILYMNTHDSLVNKRYINKDRWIMSIYVDLAYITIFYYNGKQIDDHKEGRDRIVIVVKGGKARKKGDDGKGHTQNIVDRIWRSEVLALRPRAREERRRDAVCAALSLACLKLL